VQKGKLVLNLNSARLTFWASTIFFELAGLLMTSGPNLMSMTLSVIYLRFCLPKDQKCIFRTSRSISRRKGRRVDESETMVSDYQDKLKCMITEYETWIYAYDTETTDQ